MTSKARRVVLGCVVAIGTLWVGWRLAHPRNVVTDARELLEAAERGDGRRVFDFAQRYEVEQLGLTAAKVDRLFDELIEPRMRRLVPDGPIQLRLGAGGAQGLAHRTFRDPETHFRWSRAVQANATDDHGRALVMGFLVEAWRVDFLRRGGASDDRGALAATLEGVRRDRPALERIGIPGIARLDPELPWMSWDEIEAEYDRRLQALASDR